MFLQSTVLPAAASAGCSISRPRQPAELSVNCCRCGTRYSKGCVGAAMPSAEGAPSKVKLIVSSDGDVTDDFIESLFRQREVDYALRQHQSGLERQGVAHFPARSRAARLLQRPSSSSSSIERKDYLRRSYDINPYSKPKQQLQPAAGPRAVRGRAPVRASTGARVSSADGHSRGCWIAPSMFSAM